MDQKAFHMTLLFDFYGDLLTDRQKEFYDLYHNEDLSLAEIAENAGITRQGVRDVLVRAESGTGYLTVSLYGVSPRYTVSTDTGEWQEGRKHDTRRERDDALAPGTSYVKTYGSDGSRISVVRTVYGPDGSVVRQDNFVSNYAPITEVIVEGPEAPDEPEPPKDQGSGNVESGEDSGQGSQSDGAQGGADAQQSSQG